MSACIFGLKSAACMLHKLKIMFGGLTGKPLPCLCILAFLILSLFITALDLRGYFSSEPSIFPHSSLIKQYTPPKNRISNAEKCDLPLKVYMYEWPRRFNLGMLKKNSSDPQLPWTSSKMPPWPHRSGLKKQHSVEYWMTVYLLGQYIGNERERAAIRVKDPDQADVHFVPFFASLSFNSHGQTMRDPETEIDKQMQIEVVDMLKRSKSWQQSGGRNHEGVVRLKLAKILGNHKRVIIEDSVASTEGFEATKKGMRSSRFCLHPAGDTPSSCRLFDAIVSHCVPVIVSDRIELPYEDEIDYQEFALFFSVKEALKPGYLIEQLENFPKERWLKMWNKLKQVEHHFEYQYPPKKDDAVNMLWKQIHRKLPSVNLAIHRTKRLKIPDWWRKL
ncbi:probable arabinosyltransferase ARAD1 isoform X2 [Cryptomeria japonica]|uniref:probable arabinosyltransferase ARAD1 isoform X2 n=1 Tax=Cryptomeria japonica TaxID=3369 RepID=UPI0025AD3157|nr:probable arabinosyltransferase ARAD1 isoform X2 [Cryptomeria japonica]